MINNYRDVSSENKRTNKEDTKPKKDPNNTNDDTKGTTEPIIEIVKPFKSSEKKLVFTEDPKTKPKDPEPKTTPEPEIEIVKPFKKKQN